MTGRRLAAVAALLCATGAVGAVGCQTSLPTEPSDLATGIVVYEHANFLGASGVGVQA